MGKKKILIYSDCYIYGGSEKLVSYITKNNFIQERFNITLVYRNHKIYQDAINREYSFEEKKMLFPLPIASNATFFYKINLLNIPNIIKKGIKLPFYIIEKLGLFFIYNLLLQIYVLSRLSPDIIHINNGGYPGAGSCSTMVFASKLIRKIPIVYQINNTTSNQIRRFHKLFDILINKWVKFFITASKHSRDELIRCRSFSSKKIIQVPNTIFEESITISREELLNELQIKHTDFVLCNIGFLSKRKGQIYLLEALNLLHIQDPIVFDNISLLLVGNGEEEASLRQYSTLNNLNRKVHFLGYQAQFNNYLNSCDLFIFPSIEGEDMPLVILSAMNLGKTILATDVAGIREEIEDNQSGVLITLNTKNLSKMLAEKIIELYYNRNSEMGRNAKLRYQQIFSNSIFIKTILDIYESLINI